ncbi:MAG: hypothetical protein KJ620_07410 [Candidatus Edwardsbacteria bacterium]|nr:hypothetical protein [Candidatus Edwardsbacteria bacterium]MBU1577753.1 hypothetical protein [Candidatus Edwardsbacteria bacterium]MBU2462550.1 hypothetical protein [Candidatus Edwardsbacteria bacterium]MBU2594692.1 hypothetical protein [Candidatus Edwardsbacteria bacterium]
MVQKVYKVIKGYTELDYEQRKEAREYIKKYEETEISGRKPLTESLQKSLGPISSDTCPCCGR